MAKRFISLEGLNKYGDALIKEGDAIISKPQKEVTFGDLRRLAEITKELKEIRDLWALIRIKELEDHLKDEA